MGIFSFYYSQGTDFGIWLGRAREVCASGYETPSQEAGRPVFCVEVQLGDSGMYIKGPPGDSLTSTICFLLEEP